MLCEKNPLITVRAAEPVLLTCKESHGQYPFFSIFFAQKFSGKHAQAQP
jgi:hypothetical protein